MKKAVVAVITSGFVVVLGAQADAKGISYAHFGGPGLPSGGVTIRGDDEALWETGLVAKKTQAQPTEIQLGPAYRAAYRMDYRPRVTLHQVVYPYAEGGPLTYTPDGQHIGQDYTSFPAGWYYSSPELLRFLVAHGFPQSAPGTETKTMNVKQSATSAPADSSAGWIWGVVAAVAVALIASTFAARRFVRARSSG